MIITLTGDQFGIKQTITQLTDRFIAKFGPHGYEKIDGESFEPTNLATLFLGVSLFAPQRLIILKDAAKNKSLWDAMGDWIAKVPDGTTLVVVEPELDKRTKTYKVLKSKTEFKEFPAASLAELTKWLQTRVKELGGVINSEDAQYLANRVAGDQWRLSYEIEKLANHKAGITHEAIDDLVEPSAEGSAFELLDVALAGDHNKVQKLIQNLKDQEDPYKLFGLLISQVHALAVLSAAGDRPPDQIAKDADLHPFVVRKSQTVAKRLGAKRIAEIVEQVSNCDVQLKTTAADPWFLLSLTLQKLSN